MSIGPFLSTFYAREHITTFHHSSLTVDRDMMPEYSSQHKWSGYYLGALRLVSTDNCFVYGNVQAITIKATTMAAMAVL